MPTTVLFHGQSLSRPGSYTHVDTSAFVAANLSGVGIMGLIGEADNGPPGVSYWNTPADIRRVFKSGPVVEAADASSKGSSDDLIAGQPTQYVVYKVNTGSQSSLVKGALSFTSRDYGVDTNLYQIRVSAPFGGRGRTAVFSYMVGGVVNTLNTPNVGDVGKLSLRYVGAAGGASVTVSDTALSTNTFAAAGLVTSLDGTFALSNGSVLAVKIDGGPEQALSFNAAVGYVETGNAPFNITAGSDLQIKVNGGATQTFVFAASAGYVQGLLGNFAALNTTTLILKVDGGAPVTVTFTALEVDATTTAAKIASVVGAGITTSVVAGQVRITSVRLGTGSSIEITGVNAAAGFPSLVLQTGAGDVSNSAAVTAAEVATKLSGLTNAQAVVIGTKVRLQTLGLGTSFSIMVLAASTADTALSLDNILHNGTGDAANIVAVTAAEVVTKLSALTGATASVVGNAFKIVSNLVNAGSSVQVTTTTTITAFGFDNLVHVGGGVVAGDNLNLSFTNYRTLADLIRAINVTGVYVAAELTSNTAWENRFFDSASVSDCKAAASTLYASNWDLFDAIGTYFGELISVALTTGLPGPQSVFSDTPFIGGTRGNSSNLDWGTGFDKLQNVHINQLVVCESTDTPYHDMTSILAGVKAHVQYCNSTVGRQERVAWVGVYKTNKTDIKNLAVYLNTSDIVLVLQKVKRASAVDNNVRVFPEYITAAQLAGMRAGADTGEPLTRKYVSGLDYTATGWDALSPSETTELMLAGCTVVEYIVGLGWRILKGVTTYTRDLNNDVLVKEEMIQNVKQYTYELRNYVERQLVGRPNTQPRIAATKSYMVDYSEKAAKANLIVAGTRNGAIVPAYRNIRVTSSGNVINSEITISPAEGIDFVLTDIYTTPATND